MRGVDIETLTLISHPLCPYVQRAVIALTEKGVAFTRIDVDLAAKPDWFRALSPLGTTPVLRVGERPVFESAVILEYLEETAPNPLHPSDPLERAAHRGWIEVASAALNDIAGLYNAPDAAAFADKVAALKAKLGRLEAALGSGPWFAGARFSLVDAAWGPVFRYFDVIDPVADLGLFAEAPKVRAWRAALAARPSVRDAAAADYPARLRAFLIARGAHLSRLMVRDAA